MILNVVIAVILRYSSEIGSFEAECVKVVEDIPRQKCSLKLPVFSDITYDDMM